MNNAELDKMIEWCRKKLREERDKPYGFGGKKLEGYDTAMNEVIVLPCKVGDTLYVNYKYLRNWESKTYPVRVNAIRLDTKKNNHRICVRGTFHLKEDYSYKYMATFKFDSIGKTLFRTREEAEQALKEMKGGE